MDTGHFDQAFELFVAAFRFVYNWTVGLIGRALSMGPEGLPPLKLLVWIVLLLFLIYLTVQLIRVLWIFFQNVWFLGSFAVMVVLAALMVYAPNSFFELTF